MGMMRNTADYLNSLRETAHTLSGALQESDAVQALLVQVVSALEARGALVRLLCPDGDELRLAGTLGLSEEYIDKGPVRVAESQVDQRVLAGEVVIIPDVTREPGAQYPRAAAREGLRGIVAVPLLVRGRVIGVLRIYVDEVSALTQEDILLLDTLADLGALVLEKVHLHQSLYYIAQALNTTLELGPMLEQVLAAAAREMGLKAASIRLLDAKGRTLRLVAAHGLSEAYLSKGEIHVDQSLLDQRVLGGEVVVLYDVEREAGFEYPEEAIREGLRSVLVVPLKLKDRTLGVLRVYSARPRHFGRVAIRFLTSVADLVALAIENAELYGALQARYEDLKLDLAEWHRFLTLG
jgi:signal transduction protein with GAF and PtsI domain